MVEPELAAPAAAEGAATDAARRRLEDALARLEREVQTRIAQVRADARAEAAGRLAALELEVAKLKAEKRDLERANGELRRAADVAALAIDQAMGSVKAVLDETVGNA
jgi:hypothetical protein